MRRGIRLFDIYVCTVAKTVAHDLCFNPRRHPCFGLHILCHGLTAQSTLTCYSSPAKIWALWLFVERVHIESNRQFSSGADWCLPQLFQDLGSIRFLLIPSDVYELRLPRGGLFCITVRRIRGLHPSILERSRNIICREVITHQNPPSPHLCKLVGLWIHVNQLSWNSRSSSLKIKRDEVGRASQWS